MASPDDRRQTFDTTVIAVGRRVYIPVPFDPDQAWGAKPQHHVHGTVNSMGVRAVIEPAGDGLGIVLGPAWRRDCGSRPATTLPSCSRQKDLNATTSPPTSSRRWSRHRTPAPLRLPRSVLPTRLPPLHRLNQAPTRRPTTDRRSHRTAPRRHQAAARHVNHRRVERLDSSTEVLLEPSPAEPRLLRRLVGPSRTDRATGH